MNAPLRHAQLRIDPLAVFEARAEARAILWAACELDLHEAVDALQAAAETSGLVEGIGQDAVQAILHDAFHRVRTAGGKCSTCATFDLGWAEAAREYHANRPPMPDPKNPDVVRARARARRLLEPGVSFERAWHEIQRFPCAARTSNSSRGARQ
jgi:hypothetical protein